MVWQCFPLELVQKSCGSHDLPSVPLVYWFQAVPEVRGARAKLQRRDSHACARDPSRRQSCWHVHDM